MLCEAHCISCSEEQGQVDKRLSGLITWSLQPTNSCLHAHAVVAHVSQVVPGRQTTLTSLVVCVCVLRLQPVGAAAAAGAASSMAAMLGGPPAPGPTQGRVNSVLGGMSPLQLYDLMHQMRGFISANPAQVGGCVYPYVSRTLRHVQHAVVVTALCERPLRNHSTVARKPIMASTPPFV